MAHYTILLIGTHKNLDDIYNDCPDSSSESRSEMAFGYDYLDKSKDESGGEIFIKDIKAPLINTYYDCLDIRDRKLYKCIDSVDWKERPTDKEMDEYFKSLPEDTVIFYGEAHN